MGIAVGLRQTAEFTLAQLHLPNSWVLENLRQKQKEWEIINWPCLTSLLDAFRASICFHTWSARNSLPDPWNAFGGAVLGTRSTAPRCNYWWLRHDSTNTQWGGNQHKFQISDWNFPATATLTEITEEYPSMVLTRSSLQSSIWTSQYRPNISQVFPRKKHRVYLW